MKAKQILRNCFIGIFFCVFQSSAFGQASGDKNSEGNPAENVASTLRLNVKQLEGNVLHFLVIANNPSSERAIISVMDNNSQVLHRINFSNETYAAKFNLSELPDGMYNIELASKKQKVTKSIHIFTKIEENRIVLLQE